MESNWHALESQKKTYKIELLRSCESLVFKRLIIFETVYGERKQCYESIEEI